ncbi:hypothetical protein [Salipaludibacillus daqingensis]|uniref:hypothetical protein n=1 Tax=Salipaludibacillus daqingensis TaxID=3041001 RepID=UPI0024770BAA|nr:hypothetical protein [Salipaludibacillus daqingensis]
MDEKKQIIIKEIKKWQENKLLPETYCQFLLSLYMEGSEKKQVDPIQKSSYLPHAKKALISFSIMILLLLVIAFVVYFTQLSEIFQVVTLVVFLGVCIVIARFYHYNKSVFAHVYVILASFISFITTVISIDLLFSNNRVYIGVGIVILCLAWILAGWRYRYHYLYIAGATGILLFIGLILVERI